MAAVTGPISTLPSSRHSVRCKYCTGVLVKNSSDIWVEAGRQVFPQYCDSRKVPEELKLPNGNSRLHEPMGCDDHPDRPAVARVQGETDSFGCEMHDLCQECLDEFTKVVSEDAKVLRFCDWCKSESDTCRPHRDYEEGSAGPVYQVCSACRTKEMERLVDDGEYDSGLDGDDWYSDIDLED